MTFYYQCQLNSNTRSYKQPSSRLLHCSHRRELQSREDGRRARGCDQKTAFRLLNFAGKKDYNEIVVI